jgi:hypothetical protein
METTPDIVVINLGTNDNNVANNVSATAYVDAYTKLIQGVHGKYPNAQIVVMVSEMTKLDLKTRSVLGLRHIIPCPPSPRGLSHGEQRELIGFFL